jgi:hypothetical protein
MRYLGGHLGIAVSALVDGQLDAPSAERAWDHVHGCEICRRQVEREGWVKTQLASMPGDEGPPPQLLGSLYSLGQGAEAPDPAAAWAAVEELERRGRGRRRAGIALVGAGSVSAAVLGLASLTGSTLGIGGAATNAPTTAPTVAPTAVIAPVARVHGRLSLDRPGQGEGHDGLRP